MESDREDAVHQESYRSIQELTCINCGQAIERDSLSGWTHYHPRTLACLVDGKVNDKGLKADAGYEAYPDPRVPGCSCVLVRIDSLIGGIDWRPSCQIHGKDTEYYETVFLPKMEAANEKLLELYARRKAKWGR